MQLCGHRPLLTKPPCAQVSPAGNERLPRGRAQSWAMPGQLLTAAPAGRVAARVRQGQRENKWGKKGHRSTNSGCWGLWGQAGRVCSQGRFISIVLLGSAVLRWGGWERVAVSFLSALISMVTRGTRGPGLKYALPPVLPSG